MKDMIFRPRDPSPIGRATHSAAPPDYKACTKTCSIQSKQQKVSFKQPRCQVDWAGYPPRFRALLKSISCEQQTMGEVKIAPDTMESLVVFFCFEIATCSNGALGESLCESQSPSRLLLRHIFVPRFIQTVALMAPTGQHSPILST